MAPLSSSLRFIKDTASVSRKRIFCFKGQFRLFSHLFQPLLFLCYDVLDHHGHRVDPGYDHTQRHHVLDNKQETANGNTCYNSSLVLTPKMLVAVTTYKLHQYKAIINQSLWDVLVVVSLLIPLRHLSSVDLDIGVLNTQRTKLSSTQTRPFPEHRGATQWSICQRFRHLIIQ